MYIQTSDDEDRKLDWVITIAPQCLTDILIQVSRPEGKFAALTFGIGELMRDEIEGDGDFGGMLQLSNERAANLTRWADQLEIYAALMRSSLKCRRPE